MKEVAPNIYVIKEKGSFGAIKPPENIYILAGEDGLIFDAGYGKKRAVNFFIKQFKKLEKEYQKVNKPFNINRILPSHCHPDHFSGLKKIREKLNVRILLTERMASAIKNEENFRKSFLADLKEDYYEIKKGFKAKIKSYLQSKISSFFYKRIYGFSFIPDPDEIINEDGDIIINNEKWKIFPSPGHSPDHISLYNEEKGILFSGDNVLRSITTWLGPPNCDIEDYINTIKTIKSLPKLELILPAHGSPVTNPRDRLDEILEHRKERTNQVLDIIKNNSNNGVTAGEIVKQLYPNGGKFTHQIARGWVCLTLKMLERQSIVYKKEDVNAIKFYPIK